jgi:protein-L-isoaspartate(D-aspartate) O-methyltransferase
VESLVAAALASGVRDERVFEAIRAVPRAAFVPDHLVELAGVDEPLPIPHGQVTTQPSLVAKMVEALGLEGSEHVLEVGTGYGWQTAILCRLAARVSSVERHADLAETARANLARFGADNVQVVVGDGSSGLPEHAPFDAILVSAAFPRVPSPLAEQLADGARLVQPIGHGGSEDVTLFERRGGGLVPRRGITGARFVPLVGRHGFPPDRGSRFPPR